MSLNDQMASYGDPDYQPIPPVDYSGHTPQVQPQTPPPVPATTHVVNQQAPVRQARDKAQYVRQQKGHSLTLHLLFGGLVLWIPALYITFSPNHYWHA